MRSEEVRGKNVFSIGSLLVSLQGTLLRSLLVSLLGSLLVSLLRSLLVSLLGNSGIETPVRRSQSLVSAGSKPRTPGIDTPGIETHDSVESKPHHQGSTPLASVGSKPRHQGSKHSIRWVRHPRDSAGSKPIIIRDRNPCPSAPQPLTP